MITGPTVVDCNTYHLQLTATDSSAGTFNWSDGNSGSVDNIYSGGEYELWFTDANGCVDTATLFVPYSPEIAMQYFPTGCYTVCAQQTPLTLYGPPDELFYPWNWIRDTSSISAGTGSVMSPYVLTQAGTYQWFLNNGLCSELSPDMDVTLKNCNNCGNAVLHANMVCLPDDPASYQVNVTLIAPPIGSTYTLGTDLGPVAPFSGVITGPGPYSLTLTFTTLTVPPPPVVNVEVAYSNPAGTLCFQKVAVPVPECTWASERTSGGSPALTVPQTTGTSSAMLVFPNPTSGAMTISYDYGSSTYAQRSLTIYDDMGRETETTNAQDVRGSWELNTTNWTPGIYIIKMEGDGQALQTQRVVVTH